MADNIEKTEAGKIYEVGFLLIPTISEEKLPEAFAGVKSLIEKSKALLIAEESPKLKILSYSMEKISGTDKQKFDRAYFSWVKFETLADNVENIKQALTAFPSMIRFILINATRETLPLHHLAMKTPETRTYRPKVEVKPGTPTTPASIAEIDKSIEELVIS